MMKEYHVNIKRRRLELDLSQEDVANKLRCDYSTYGKIENGRTALSVDRLLEIARILDTDAPTLLGHKHHLPDTSQMRAQLSLQVSMTPEELKASGLDKLFRSYMNPDK